MTRKMILEAAGVQNAQSITVNTVSNDSQVGSCVLGAPIVFAMVFIAFPEGRAGMMSSPL